MVRELAPSNMGKKRQRKRNHRGRANLLKSIASLPPWGRELLKTLKNDSPKDIKKDLQHLHTVQYALFNEMMEKKAAQSMQSQEDIRYETWRTYLQTWCIDVSSDGSSDEATNNDVP